MAAKIQPVFLRFTVQGGRYEKFAKIDTNGIITVADIKQNIVKELKHVPASMKAFPSSKEEFNSKIDDIIANIEKMRLEFAKAK